MYQIKKNTCRSWFSRCILNVLLTFFQLPREPRKSTNQMINILEVSPVMDLRLARMLHTVHLNVIHIPFFLVQMVARIPLISPCFSLPLIPLISRFSLVSPGFLTFPSNLFHFRVFSSCPQGPCEVPRLLKCPQDSPRIPRMSL